MANLILQSEDVLQRSIIALGPQMFAGGGVNQLHDNAYLPVGFLHAPFQYVPHAHLVADVLHLDGFTFVRERRGAGDDKQTGEA